MGYKMHTKTLVFEFRWEAEWKQYPFANPSNFKAIFQFVWSRAYNSETFQSPMASSTLALSRLIHSFKVHVHLLLVFTPGGNARVLPARMHVVVQLWKRSLVFYQPKEIWEPPILARLLKTILLRKWFIQARQLFTIAPVLVSLVLEIQIEARREWNVFQRQLSRVQTKDKEELLQEGWIMPGKGGHSL